MPFMQGKRGVVTVTHGTPCINRSIADAALPTPALGTGCGSDGAAEVGARTDTSAITAEAPVDTTSAAPSAAPTASQALVPTASASAACVPLSASVSAAPVAGAPKRGPKQKRLVEFAGFPED